MSEPTCGVCAQPLTSDWMDQPTFSFVEVPGRPGAVRPVLNKPIRMDPDTGAVCWCPQPVPVPAPGAVEAS